MNETQRERRGYKFIPAEVTEWPGLYSTEDTPVGDKLIVAHYFGGAADWWVTEYDPDENIGFGYVSLGLGGDEWGIFSFAEMEGVRTTMGLIIERDLYWEVKKVRDILPPEAWDWDKKEGNENIY